MTDKAWVRRIGDEIVILNEIIGELVRVSVSGRERMLTRAEWQALPLHVA